MPLDLPDLETWIATLTDDAGGGADDGTPIDKAFLTTLRQKLEQGGMLPRASKTTTYTANATADCVIFADTSGGAWTLTLPAEEDGLFYFIKKTTSDANALTINNDAAGLVHTISTEDDGVLVVSDGTGWEVFTFPSGRGLPLIASATAGSNVIDMDPIVTTAYDSLLYVCRFEVDTSDVDVYLEINNVTSALYYNSGIQHDAGGSSEGKNLSGGSSGWEIAENSIATWSIGASTEHYFFGVFELSNDFTDNSCHMVGNSHWRSQIGQNWTTQMGGTVDVGSDTSITAIRLHTSSGGIDVGWAKLYGRVLA